MEASQGAVGTWRGSQYDVLWRIRECFVKETPPKLSLKGQGGVKQEENVKMGNPKRENWGTKAWKCQSDRKDLWGASR